MPGPKKRPRELNRAEYIAIRLTNQEKQSINKLAKRQNKSVSELVRSVILSILNDEPVKLISFDFEDFYMRFREAIDKFLEKECVWEEDALSQKTKN